MALQDQIVPIDLLGGINTKSDEKSVNVTSLLSISNGVFERPGRIQKRNGFDNLDNAIVGGGSINLSTGLSANLNTNQLIQFADDATYAYSEVKTGWLNVGSTYPVSAKNTVVFDSYLANGVQPPDMCIIGNYELYSYQVTTNAASNGVQLLIKDRITKNILYQSSFLNPDPAAISKVTKILAWNAFAYQINTGNSVDAASQNIIITKIDPTLVNPIVSSITITRTVSAIRRTFFDAMITPLGLMVSYMTSNTIVTTDLYDANLGLIQTANVTCPANVLDIAIAFDTSDSNTFIVMASTQLYYAVLSAAFASVLAPTQVNSGSSYGAGDTPTYNRTSATMTAANQITILAQSLSSSPSTAGAQPLISKWNVSATAVTFEDFNWENQGVLVSKIGSYNGKYFVVTGYAQDQGDSGQFTYYLHEVSQTGVHDVNTLGNVARFLIGSAADEQYNPAVSTNGAVPKPELFLNGTSLIIALQMLSSLDLKLSAAILSVAKEEFNFLDPITSSISTVPDTNFLVSGGTAITVDDYASEEEFNNFPEPPTLVENTGAGPGLSAGTYQYFAVYEWIDGKGQVHQSSPSLAATITVAANSTVGLTYYTLLSTSKRTPVTMVFFRTVANGITAYRMTESPPSGQPVIYYLNQTQRMMMSIKGISDSMTDTDIQNNEILYTDGGILPNDPAPSSTFQWLYKNRVMLGGLDDGNQIWYSKTRVAGEPVKFSGFFFTQVDIAGGDVTAGATLDDKCIFFKKNKIFYMFGDGPNDAGGGSSFSVPQEIASPCGSPFPKSIVNMPLGVMFKSDKGIYLLDRGLNVTYIGAFVEAYNQFNITSTIHMPEYNQVRFSLDNGQELMYDYLVKQWSVFDNIQAVGSALYQDTYVYVRPSGELLQEVVGTFLDDGVPITLSIGIPWIKLSSLQSFQRAKQLLLLGNYFSPHTLTVQVGFDYNDTYTETFNWTPDGMTAVDQFRIFLQTQKCEAVRMLISDNATSTTGEGYNLAEISVLCGMKKGQFKLPAVKSIG